MGRSLRLRSTTTPHPASRFILLLLITLLLSGALHAQAGFKAYPTNEAYCADNPHAPTCVNGKPMKFEPLKIQPFKLPGMATPQPRKPMAPPPAPPSLNLRPDWRFAHPHAGVMLGLNVASLRQSPTLRALLAQLTEKLHLNAADVENVLAQTADIDQIWLSLRDRDALFLMQGRMKLPEGFIQLPNGMTSYRISSTAIVMGREATVAEAVQRLWRPPAAPVAANLTMKQLGANNDLWMVASKPGLIELHSDSLAPDMTGFTVALKLQDGVNADVRLNFAKLATATRIATQARNDPPPAAFSAITVQQTGTTVRVTIGIGKNDLAKALDQALAGKMGQQLSAALTKNVNSSQGFAIYGGAGQRSPAGNAIPPSSSANQPGMVIYGLRDGKNKNGPPH